MAIPFFEPKNDSPMAEQQTVDQVDGPVSSHQPSYESLNYNHDDDSASMEQNQQEATVAGNTTINSPLPSTSTSSDELAWKTLAVAMCKVLKEHYTKKAQSNSEPITSAVVQIMPNGQVNPIWK